MKGPLKWHGGKYYLQDVIHSLAPASYQTRVVGCAGGMQELWNWACPHCGQVPPSHDKQCPGLSEVVNDTNEELANFYSVLRHDTNRQKLIDRLMLTQFGRSEFNLALTRDGRNGPVERARRFFVRYRQSRQGLGKDFATLSTGRLRRQMNEQVSSWLGAIEGLPDVVTRLESVVVESCPVVDLIRRLDSPTTFFYLDPPYLPETRQAGGYDEEMKELDHMELLALLATPGYDWGQWPKQVQKAGTFRLQGKFLLSGYASRMYSDVAELDKWHTHQVEVSCSSSSRKKKDQRQECFWMNYAPKRN